MEITDVNDKAPTFAPSEFTARVNESAPAGTAVFRAEATDEDIGLNGQIRSGLGRYLCLYVSWFVSHPVSLMLVKCW